MVFLVVLLLLCFVVVVVVVFGGAPSPETDFIVAALRLKRVKLAVQVLSVRSLFASSVHLQQLR